MNLNELKAQVALGEDSRRQFKQDVTNRPHVAKIRIGNSNIRNPILVSYITKRAAIPYRGLGSGIKRALEDWSEIDFSDDRDGCLFTAIVHRKEVIYTEVEADGEKTPGKTPGETPGENA